MVLKNMAILATVSFVLVCSFLLPNVVETSENQPPILNVGVFLDNPRG